MSKRTLLVGVAALSALSITAVFARAPLHAIVESLAELKGASPVWLAAAAAAFLAASLASASAWHSGLRACGSALGRWPVTQRYAPGCLANTFAPANAGEVVRVALLSRAIGSEGAVFTVIGVSAVVALIRVSVVGTLFVATTATSRTMLWLPIAVLPVVALGGCAFHGVRGRIRAGRVRHVLDVVRGLAAQPLAAMEITACVATGTIATLLASACVAAAFGVPHPLAAALVVVPAMELARALPITPGNLGLTSAAVALALHGQGVSMEVAVAAGIALHAVETVVGVSFGVAGVLSLAPTPRLWLSLRARLGGWPIAQPVPVAIGREPGRVDTAPAGADLHARSRFI